MKATGVDVLISAPQKGWSSSPSAGLVMMSARALERLEATTSNSFAIDLKKWHQIMQAYLNGGHAYHATMPTDALRDFRDTMQETAEMGFDALRAAQWKLGDGVRAYLIGKGMKPVAADGFGAPGVIVSYTDDPDIQNGSKFVGAGMQIAAGVPRKALNALDSDAFLEGLVMIYSSPESYPSLYSYAKALETIESSLLGGFYYKHFMLASNVIASMAKGTKNKSVQALKSTYDTPCFPGI
jgi:hypothetical protein